LEKGKIECCGNWDENGVCKCKTKITNMTNQEKSQKIIQELDRYGRKYDRKEFGLPVHSDEFMEEMRAMVLWIIEDNSNPNNYPEKWS
jgi:hypothetical protein